MKSNQSSLTTKDQVTIPANIREKMNLSTGNKIEFLIHENHIVIVPINQLLKNLKGFYLNRINPLHVMKSIM